MHNNSDGYQQNITEKVFYEAILPLLRMPVRQFIFLFPIFYILKHIQCYFLLFTVRLTFQDFKSWNSPVWVQQELFIWLGQEVGCKHRGGDRQDTALAQGAEAVIKIDQQCRKGKLHKMLHHDHGEKMQMCTVVGTGGKQNQEGAVLAQTHSNPLNPLPENYIQLPGNLKM